MNFINIYLFIDLSINMLPILQYMSLTYIIFIYLFTY